MFFCYIEKHFLELNRLVGGIMNRNLTASAQRRITMSLKKALLMVTISGVAAGSVSAYSHSTIAAPKENHAIKRETLKVAQQERPRIAILNFDFRAISNPNYLSLIPGGASGVSNILLTKLVNQTDYRVIERSQIETIMKEQNLGQSGRINSRTAAEIGEILGVEAVVFGSVNQFDLQEQESGGFVGNLVGAEVEETDAIVSMSYRVVQTDTAEIIAAGRGQGKASQSDTSVSVFGIGGGSDTDNRTKLLTQATEVAMDKVVKTLKDKYDTIASYSNSQSGELQDNTPGKVKEDTPSKAKEDTPAEANEVQ